MKLFVRLSLLLAVPLALSLFLSNPSIRKGVSGEIRGVFNNALVRVDGSPEDSGVDALYVLGGPPRSLVLKFRTAASLYHEGMSEMIWIMSTPGITRYSKELGRNLTNDEWATGRLESYNIPSDKIIPIVIEEKFFGTFSEAEGIIPFLEEGKVGKLGVISSPHHTHRVKLCFEHSLRGKNIQLFFYGSSEKAPLTVLIIEFIKLTFYKLFLLRG